MLRSTSRALLVQILCCFLFVCLLTFEVSAAPEMPTQENPSQTKKEDKAQELQKQAMALLEQTIAESKALSLPQNHVTVEQEALELLWKRDRSRAKGLVGEITGRIIEMQNRADADPDSQRATTVYQLRMQMIQLLAGLDPRMALNFLQSTRSTSGVRDAAERQLEYSLVTQAASADPRMALAMAKKTLNEGLSFQLNGIYSSLSQTDADAANELAQDIVAKLRSENLASNRQAWYFAINFLGQVAPQGSRRSRSGLQSGATESVSENNPGMSNPGVARQITDLLVGAALTPNMPQDLLRGLQPYSDLIAQYSPGKAPQLQQQLSQAQQSVDPQVRTWERFNQINSHGSVDESLAVAAQASPEVRSGMYQQVAWKAASDGDYLRARQIVMDDVADPLQRNQMLREITKQAAFRAAGQGNFEAARDLMQGFTPAEEHATVLAQVAHSAAARGDVKTASRVLEEARGLLDNRPENATQLNALLQVAQGYAEVAPAAGFQIVESIAGQLSEIVNASAMVDGFTPYSKSFESGEMVLHNGYVADSLVRPFADTLAMLAQRDFGRAKAIADSLQPTEARVLAHMVMAKHLLVE